jgi:hypothetical protein
MGLPITLDTVRIADRNACRAFTDSGAATYAVWEQVRAGAHRDGSNHGAQERFRDAPSSTNGFSIPLQ